MDKHPRFPVFRLSCALYTVFCAALVLVYALKRDGYHLVISLGALAVPPAMALTERLLRLKRVPGLNLIVLAFVFLAYPLGACVDFYRILPGFDKLAHGLSGVFVSFLCLLLYYALKPGHAVEKRDAALAAVFVFFGSAAVAGLWEVGEYLLSAVVRIDLQRVRTTGISDSMLDMIVCLIGTLAFLPFVRRLTLGKSDPVSRTVREFLALNFPG